MPGVRTVNVPVLGVTGEDLVRPFQSTKPTRSVRPTRAPFSWVFRGLRKAIEWMASASGDGDFGFLSGVDTRAGLARVGGDAALYIDLLLRFRMQHIGSISHIWASITAGDEPRARHHASVLRGDAALLGMVDVFRVARKLEAVLREPPVVSLPVLLELEAVLMEVIHGLKDLVPMSIADTSSDADPEQLMRELWFLLITNDCRAAGMAYVLRRRMRQLGREAEILPIANCVERYDFAGALDLLTGTVTVVRGRDADSEEAICR